MAQNSWGALAEPQPQTPEELALAKELGLPQSSPDIQDTTKQSTIYAAQVNPAPSVPYSPAMNQPSSQGTNVGSVFSLNSKNQLPDEINYQKQVASLFNQTKNADNASLEDQKKQLAAYKEQIQRGLNSPTEVSLKPLAALTDAWTGSHFAQNYEAPLTTKDKQALAAKLQDELLKRTQDLTKDQRDALKDRLSAQLGLAKISKDSSTSTQMRMQESNAKHLETAQKNLNTDKNYLKSGGIIEETNSVAHQLDSALQNPVAAAATPIALARMMTGGQRLNEVEINALGGAPGIMNRLQQIAQTMQNGTLDQSNHDFMLQLADTLRKSAEENQIEAEKKHANQYSKLTGQPFADSYMNLTGKSSEDVDRIQARDWVKKNPKDKRVAEIRKHYGF